MVSAGEPIGFGREASSRRLGAALFALEAFGVELDMFSPGQRAELVSMVGRALTAASGLEALPEGSTLELETHRDDRSRGVRLHLCTPQGELMLEAQLGTEGQARFRLGFTSAEGWSAQSERTAEVAVVPAEAGVLLVPRRLEDTGAPHRGQGGPDGPSSVSQEGWAAFLEGALFGDFSDHESWSALAGQVAIGFVPIAGQVADVRDLFAALEDLAEGHAGAGLSVGAAALGFIPGLDFLKAGTRLSRRAIKEAAENIDDAARAGLKQAAKKMSAEGAERAKKELATLNAGRAELMARLEDLLARGGIDEQILKRSEKLRRGLRDHLEPADLTGALRDRLGIPVSKKDGTGAVWDHLNEVESAIRSMEKTPEMFGHDGEESRRSRREPEYTRSVARGSQGTQGADGRLLGAEMNDRNELILVGSSDTSRLAEAIIDAGRARDESMVEVIASYLGHEDYEVRGAAVRALVFWMERPEYFGHAVHMTKDPEFDVRVDAISSVGCLARARPEYRERAAIVLVEAVRSAEEPLDAHGPYEWLAEIGLVPFRLWDEEPPFEVLAAIEAAMGKLPDPG